ncbi:MAG: hypothetical protein HYT22_02495 [Candidatus Niyogibacteria bacterium]|nr:hypothetical protein [Candidatus Niyogibacteria bacterium]
MVRYKYLGRFSFSFIMAIQDLILLTVAMMNIVLGWLVFWNNHRTPVTRWFAVFAWSLALWAMTLVGFRTIPDVRLAEIFLKLAYASAVGIAASITAFAHYFPDRSALGRFKRWLFIGTTAAIAVIALLPNVLITRIIEVGQVRIGVQEYIGYSVFSIYFLVYFFGALYFLYRRFTGATGETRTNIGYIIWSILTAGVFGVIFNLILPSPWIQEWRYTWMGPPFTAIIVVAVAYAIAKYRLMDVRILAAELLTITIVFLLFIQSIFSSDAREFFTRIIFFLLATLFGAFLVRSVRREAEQKERLEQLTKELESANTELKKLDQLKSDFLSFASHQLRGPLSAVKGYVSMITEGTYGAITPKIADVLGRIYKSNEQLIRLVDDFLNLARIEEGRIEYAFAPVSLDELVDDVVRSLADNAFKKGLELRWEHPSPPLPVIVADASKIREVLYNLIDNAIKYTEHGWVEIRAERVRSGVRIWVRDTGVGLDAGEIGRLFTRFGRAYRTRNNNKDGVGVGLYIAKSVVEAHGGGIRAESPGKYHGSTFTVELPLKPPIKSEN